MYRRMDWWMKGKERKRGDQRLSDSSDQRPPSRGLTGTLNTASTVQLDLQQKQSSTSSVLRVCASFTPLHLDLTGLIH